MKILKKIIILFLIIIILLFTIATIAILILNNKTKDILDDYSDIYQNPKYGKAILIDNVETIKQDVSCGYAVIEMFSKWNNGKITEKTLYDKYGSVVTSTGKSFEEEMNKQFPNYKTTMHSYLKNTELINKVYENLDNGIPVPFEWAAKYENEWTLHYSLIIGIDIPNNEITIANPYGYTEKISIKDFLNRTSFESYENMPLFFKLAFAFGLFEKNTIFVVEKK